MDRESGHRSQKSSSAETIIAIGLDERCVMVDEAKAKSCRKEDRFCCCVDVNCGEEERVCRICHLNAKEDGKGKKNVNDLIELGCGCKGELGFSHLRCAEAWFKLRGNRACEICGEIAKNVKGVGNASFMEEWSEGIGSGERRSRGCRERQPFCNFLMGCLVIAFVLPWFFRVNM